MPRTVKSPGKDQIDLSVVIVSWNTRDLLERCLRSVTRETDQARIRSEIIVVDNGSSDGTVDTLEGMFPDVDFVPLERNLGFAAATNVGIRKSTGRNLLLLNPDTELQTGALAVMLKTLRAMPHVGMVSGLLLNPDGSVQSAGYRFPGLVQTFLDFFPLHPRLIVSGLNGRISPGDGVTPYAVDHPLGACMLARSEMVDAVGLLDEQYFMYSEEIDWCQRMRQSGWTVLVAPAARIVHFGGQSTGQMPDKMFWQLHRSRARYFQRYRGAGFTRAAAFMAQAAGLCAGLAPHLGGAANHDASSWRDVARLYSEARGGDG